MQSVKPLSNARSPFAFTFTLEIRDHMDSISFYGAAVPYILQDYSIQFNFTIQSLQSNFTGNEVSTIDLYIAETLYI